jgi:hypothetical protein
MPPNAIRIDPDALYAEGAVAIALDIPTATLVRARRAGTLRFRRVGKRTLYLGRWLLDWLAQDPPKEGDRDAD